MTVLVNGKSEILYQKSTKMKENANKGKTKRIDRVNKAYVDSTDSETKDIATTTTKTTFTTSSGTILAKGSDGKGVKIARPLDDDIDKSRETSLLASSNLKSISSWSKSTINNTDENNNHSFSSKENESTFAPSPSVALFIPIANCSCQCCVHSLYANCTACGNILCELDSMHTHCTFCGANVYIRSEKASVTEKIPSSTKSAAKKVDKDGKKKKKKGQMNPVDEPSSLPVAVVDEHSSSASTSDRQLQAAIDRKNRLVYFDRFTVESNQIYDDQVCIYVNT